MVPRISLNPSLPQEARGGKEGRREKEGKGGEEGGWEYVRREETGSTSSIAMDGQNDQQELTRHLYHPLYHPLNFHVQHPSQPYSIFGSKFSILKLNFKL